MVSHWQAKIRLSLFSDGSESTSKAPALDGKLVLGNGLQESADFLALYRVADALFFSEVICHVALLCE